MEKQMTYMKNDEQIGNNIGKNKSGKIVVVPRGYQAAGPLVIRRRRVRVRLRALRVRLEVLALILI